MRSLTCAPGKVNEKHDRRSSMPVMQEMTVVSVPLNRFTKPCGQVRLSLKPEFFQCPGSVQQTSGLAIGPGCVPFNFTFKTAKATDEHGQFPDGYFKARPYVHRFAFIV
jgi:hypothetical protein